MDLILWRHAEAFDAEEGQDDLGRALTPQGQRQAARMAKWLDRHLPGNVSILVSPARRTQQTAAALERTFKTVPALGPGAEADDVLAAARWPEAGDAVLVVGHQPTLGQVAARLITGAAQPWSIRKGAAWWLRYRERNGDTQVVLQSVQDPDLL